MGNPNPAMWRASFSKGFGRRAPGLVTRHQTERKSTSPHVGVAVAAGVGAVAAGCDVSRCDDGLAKSVAGVLLAAGGIATFAMVGSAATKCLQDQKCGAPCEAGAKEESGTMWTEDFYPETAYAGTREGYVFKMGDRGLGYYRDTIVPVPAHVGFAKKRLHGALLNSFVAGGGR